MGNLILREIQKRGSNPFNNAIGRNDQGALTVNLRQVYDTIAGGGIGQTNEQSVNDLMAGLGDNPTVDALSGYSRDYQGTTGGDADQAVTNTFKPIAGVSSQALDAATDSFGIQEQGRANAANIAQAGREKARGINMASGIASAQRQTLAAAEGAEGGTGEGGTPDVIDNSEVSSGGSPDDASNNEARKRRASYGGAGLAMRI